MPFVAPTFAQSTGHYVDAQGNPVPGATYTMPDGSLRWSSWDAGDGTPPVPVAPNVDAQTATRNALLPKLNLPAGWTIVGNPADASSVDSKGNKVNQGNVAVTVVGPNGEQGQIILDGSGNVAPGGQLDVKPSAPPKPTVVSPGEGIVDPTTGQTTVPVPIASPQPRTDSPAETSAAATAAQNANTAAAAQANTATHDANADANAKRLADLQAARDAADVQLKQAELDYNNKKLAADTDYQNGKLSQDQWIAERNAAHQEAQDAVAASAEADKRFADEQTAQFQQGQLSNQSAQTAEATRHNTATETEATRANQANEQNQAATLLERTQADQQASQDRQSQTNADLVSKRGELAAGHLNNWVNAAASNKNFGLGGAIPSNMAAGLMSDANTQATTEMGGQSFMDKATQLVHQANPALAGTPQGAQYAGIAAQMLEKAAQPQMQAPSPDSTDNSNTASAVSGGSGISPSDPAFIGTAVGAAIQHINGMGSSPAPGQRGSLDQFTAPGVTV